MHQERYKALKVQWLYTVRGVKTFEKGKELTALRRLWNKMKVQGVRSSYKVRLY